MILREELKLGDKMLYTPGGVEVTVTDLSHYCIGVEDDQGQFVEIPPEDVDYYERIS